MTAVTDEQFEALIEVLMDRLEKITDRSTPWSQPSTRWIPKSAFSRTRNPSPSMTLSSSRSGIAAGIPAPLLQSRLLPLPRQRKRLRPQRQQRGVPG